MAPVRQPSFSAGELAPALWGRTDLERYGKGARKVFNLFVSKAGSLVSRPGAQYLGLASAVAIAEYAPGDPSHLSPVSYRIAGAGVRLLPFRWSDTSTSFNAVLELGEQSIRVWQGGAVAATVTGAVPYKREDLFKIQYVQSGDTIFLTCIGYPPAKVVRTSAGAWAYSVITFDVRLDSAATLLPMVEIDTIAGGVVPIVGDANHPARQWGWWVTTIWRDSATGLNYETYGVPVATVWQFAGAAWRSDFSYSLGDTVSYLGHYFNSLSGAASPAGGNLNHAPAVGGNAFWTDLGAVLPGVGIQDPRGPRIFPTAGVPLYADQTITLKLDGVTQPTDPAFVCYRVYRGRGGLWGWVSDSNTASFTDAGDQPNYEQPPPYGTNPFKVYGSNGVLIRTEDPLSVAFFEDRLCFGGTDDGAGTPSRAASVFGSQPADYYNFDTRLIPSTDDAVQFALTARTREVMRTMLGLDKLFCFTDGGVWSVDGGDAPLGPASVNARKIADVGSSYLPAFHIDDLILWVRDKSTGVRALAWSWQSQKFLPVDLSYPAQHLVMGYTISDWCFQEDPWGVVWLARNDGLLLSMTRSPDDGEWGWAQHQLLGTGGVAAVVQSVCTIPEGDEDAVYLALQGSNLTLPAWSAATTYAAGDPAGYLGQNYYSKVNGNLNHAPSGATDAWWVIVDGAKGSSWICRLSTRVEAPNSYPVGLDSYLDLGAFAVGTHTAYVFPLAGLTAHGVAFAADGTQTDLGPLVVDNANNVTFTLAASAVKVAIGLMYSWEVDSLDLALERTKQKIVSSVGLELSTPDTTIQAGPDTSNLTTFRGDLDGPMSTADLVRIPTNGAYNPGGRVVLVHAGPLPLTVLGLTREVDAGAN